MEDILQELFMLNTEREDIESHMNELKRICDIIEFFSEVKLLSFEI